MTNQGINVTPASGFYAPQLDGLRLVAVTLVLLSHFAPRLTTHGSGVNLFFSLSGFLVTHLLLRERSAVDNQTLSRGVALGHFHFRRILRLWPAYFAALLISRLLHVDGTENDTILWHAGFLSNHLIFHHQSWPGLMSHFWSLAVEQQFYLLWPFLLFFTPKKHLPATFLAFAGLGLLSRFLLIYQGETNPEFASLLMPSCLAFFALGGLVALCPTHPLLKCFSGPKTCVLTSLAWIGWLLLNRWLHSTNSLPVYWQVYDGLAQAILGALLIHSLLISAGNPVVSILKLPPLVYLGKISYGIYLYHNLMHRIGPSLLRRLIGVNYFPCEWQHVLYLSTLSVLAAILSYHLMELPLRRLGRQLST